MLRVIRLPEHARRRLRLILFILFTCASLLLAWWLLFRVKNKDAVADLVGVVSMLAGLGALPAAIAQLLPPPPPPPDATEAADQLAVTVREQWSEEVGARQLREPAVIPLSWAGTDRPVAAPAETVVGPQAGRVTRLSLDGRMEGNFDHAASQLAAGFRRVPSGRLVVLGEPGAGKTVLAIMLTLGLLTDRSSHRPVPVLLSVSGWDPVSESLDDFIVGSLATSYYGGQPQIPRLLLNRRMLLPVLDGLDEIPEAARRNAVRGINEACGEGRGVVVTCRSVEYQDVIEGGSPPLRKAPVVEVAPVSVPDTIAYLNEVNWPEGVNWEPVYTHLRQHPDGPAAAALSTPLALSLARGVYRNCDRDPGELLDFESRHGIEDHLVDYTIPAAYAPPPGTLPQQADGGWQEDAQKAERWLTFLATYLHQHRERDLAWWLMSRRLLSHWSGLLIGIGLGLAAMFLVLAVDVGYGLAVVDNGFGLGWSLGTGIVVAVLAMFTWYAAPERRPGRTSFTLRGSLHRLRGGFRTGFALTSLVAVTALGITGFAITLEGDWSPPTLITAYDTIALAAGAATTISLALAVHNWLNTSPERSTRTTPKGLIHQDRKSSLVAAGLAGIALGVTGLPLLILSQTAVQTVFLASTNLSGMPPIADILMRSASSQGTNEPLEIVANTVLPGVVFTILMLLPRAWPRFILLRFVLARKGHLPWNFVQFLDDARDRQLLRQSGGLYQFRHIRLQERLASRSLAQNRVSTPHPRTARRRRLQVAVAATALAASTLLINQTMLPEDTSRIILPTRNVAAMAFAPPGKHTLVTVDEDGTVQRWDTKTGDGVTVGQVEDLSSYSDFTLGAHKSGAILFLEDENEHIQKAANIPWEGSSRMSYQRPAKWLDSVVQSTYGPLQIEKISGELILQWAAADSGAARIVGDERVEVYDPKNRLLCHLPASYGSDGEYYELSINMHGTRIARFRDATVNLWDAQCKKEDQSITTYDMVEEIAFNADGTELAVFDATGDTRLYTLKRPRK